VSTTDLWWEWPLESICCGFEVEMDWCMGLYKSRWRGCATRWPSRGEGETVDSRSAERGGRPSRSRCRGSNGGTAANAGAFMDAEEGVVGERKSVECSAMLLGI